MCQSEQAFPLLYCTMQALNFIPLYVLFRAGNESLPICNLVNFTVAGAYLAVQDFQNEVYTEIQIVELDSDWELFRYM